MQEDDELTKELEEKIQSAEVLHFQMQEPLAQDQQGKQLATQGKY
jgi:hypothetical protein